ncbi:MAG: ABC transporter substrate-binding protein [Clostridiales bacterium]|jgi:iron complex transport system substrate-binding protein|nr:ABC transporter substrate-binding protein [Clostridiales bacterium]
MMAARLTLFACLTCVFTLLFFSSCGRALDSSVETSIDEAVEFTDAFGRTLRIRRPETVAVSPSSFADVWMLAGGAVAGTTSDSFERGLDLGESAASIGAVQSPDLEMILSLNPDLVILSKTTPGHAELYEPLSNSGIEVCFFSVETFDEYLRMLEICALITGRTDLYEKNGLDVKLGIEKTIRKSEGLGSPRILLIRSYSYGAGIKNSSNMAGAMLKDLGCVNIADENESLLSDLSIETIIKEDPDFIFTILMGNSEAEALESLEAALQSNPAWAGLKAVRDGHYFVLPKELFHLKPNERWGESYEMLYEILCE